VRPRRIDLLSAAPPIATSSAALADVVTDRNEIAMRAARDAGTVSNAAAPAAAIGHISVNAAAVAITRAHSAYRRARLEVAGSASAEAAAAQAARDAPATLLPPQSVAFARADGSRWLPAATVLGQDAGSFRCQLLYGKAARAAVHSPRPSKTRDFPITCDWKHRSYCRSTSRNPLFFGIPPANAYRRATGVGRKGGSTHVR
jgi:hypothetical protein